MQQQQQQQLTTTPSRILSITDPTAQYDEGGTSGAQQELPLPWVVSYERSGGAGGGGSGTAAFVNPVFAVGAGSEDGINAREERGAENGGVGAAEGGEVVWVVDSELRALVAQQEELEAKAGELLAGGATGAVQADWERRGQLDVTSLG